MDVVRKDHIAPDEPSAGVRPTGEQDRVDIVSCEDPLSLGCTYGQHDNHWSVISVDERVNRSASARSCHDGIVGFTPAVPQSLRRLHSWRAPLRRRRDRARHRPPPRRRRSGAPPSLTTRADAADDRAMEITREIIRDGLARSRYITSDAVETVLYLALALERPLLIEGPAGAGKTEIGKVLADTLRADLIRLQCYEGLDEAKALYEWNYQKQLLRIQADRDQGLSSEEVTQHVFSREYLLERPL